MAYDYDLIVLGGGAAGLTAAGVAANLGASVLLIEQERLGGDCTWTGCIPSKTLLTAARVAHSMRAAHRHGFVGRPAEVDFTRVMEHVAAVRQRVYEEADAPEIFERMGVEVRSGRATFVDAHTVVVEGERGTERASGRFFVVATGGRALVPPIDGLGDEGGGVRYLTTHSLFDVRALPASLAILGAGPIGIEMAQAFSRLGARVSVIDRLGRILSKDDQELAEGLRAVLAREGVRFVLGAEVERVRRGESGVRLELGGEGPSVEAEALLVAAGRRPNVESLGLDAAGVAYDRQGITVDDRCRTCVGHIYAAGDVTGRYQFTHMSEHMAKVAVTNALLKVPMKIDARHVPWVTYADPELAHLGATAEELKARGVRHHLYRFPYGRIDRAVTDGEEAGEIKVYAKGLTGRILGVSILGAHAGELISEYAVAMRNGVSLRQLSDTIHPYPTYALGARRAADQWYVRKQKAWTVRLLQKVFGYRGAVNVYEPGRIV